MKNPFSSYWIRFAASALAASVLIVMTLGVVIRYFERPERDPLLSELEYVKIVNLADNPALAEAVRREREANGSLPPENEPPPMPVMPERMVSGFVHVEYTINPDGSVSDVRVVGAAPSGVYEQQAVARISRSMHAPAFNEAGDPVARSATEIVEFSVPASELAE